MHVVARLVRIPMLTAVLALALGGGTAQAVVPGVATGGASNISPQSVTLNGSVDANGKPTVYFFQYGTTKAYGVQTPDVSAGTGGAGVKVAAAVISLGPAIVYHYRLVARNPDGTTVGADRSFKTSNQPLGFTLDALPNPAPFGGATTLQGVLSGTGNAGRQVVLQQKPFPYTAAFAQVGNPQVTGSTGAFAFPLLGLAQNTQYRVVTTAGGTVASQIVTLGVAVRVTTRVSAHRVRRGGRIRFSGTITPAKVGALFAVQKLNGAGAWVTVAGGVAHGGNAQFTRYTKRIHVRRGGRYRVFVGIADGLQVSATGSEISLRTR